jgi:hypothetical protein
MGWNLIGQRERRLTLDPGDSLLVPMRASASRNVKGDIGYSIIASLTDLNNQPITSSYCFLKVPKVSSFRFLPLTRLSYFDSKTGKGSFKFKLSNNGNIDELVNLNFTSTENLEVKNEVDNEYSTDFILPAKNDTTLEYEVIIKKGANGNERSLYQIDLKGGTEDRNFQSTFWFKNLTDHYNYEIPESQKPLIVNLSRDNLFGRGGV